MSSARPSAGGALRELSDADYYRYLIDGYLILQPSDVSGLDHDDLYQQAQRLYAKADTATDKRAHLDILGDRALRDGVPQLNALLADAAVTSVLTRILGAEYLVHPHCFVHRASEFDQVFHQDGNLPWNERGHYRPHRPDWALLFYYPQAVTLANGPTAVVPQSQYWTKDHETADGDWHRGDMLDPDFQRDVMHSEDLALRDQRNAASLACLGAPDLTPTFVTVPKGAVVICNYDLVHRGSRHQPNQAARYMFKLFFARTAMPERFDRGLPTVPHNVALVRDTLKPVLRHLWQWSGGTPGPDAEHSTIDELAQQLTGDREDLRIAAAYSLANDVTMSAGGAGLELLGRGLSHEREAVRRASCYGLRGIGAAAVPLLLEHARAESPSVRRHAAYALGNAELAENTEVLEQLLALVETDVDDLVRSNAAYAVGQLLRWPALSAMQVEFAVSRLLQRLEPNVEPNNTSVAGLPRSTVRQSVTYALLQAVQNHPLNDRFQEQLQTVVNDDDRYVAGIGEQICARATLEPTSAG